MPRATIPVKISALSSASYAAAFWGVVQPRQMRLITAHLWSEGPGAVAGPEGHAGCGPVALGLAAGHQVNAKLGALVEEDQAGAVLARPQLHPDGPPLVQQ